MTTITLDAAKSQVRKDMEGWEQQDLLEAAKELMDLVPARDLEQWLARQLFDGQGITPTIEG